MKMKLGLSCLSGMDFTGWCNESGEASVVWKTELPSPFSIYFQLELVCSALKARDYFARKSHYLARESRQPRKMALVLLSSFVRLLLSRSLRFLYVLGSLGCYGDVQFCSILHEGINWTGARRFKQVRNYVKSLPSFRRTLSLFCQISRPQCYLPLRSVSKENSGYHSLFRTGEH